MRGAALWALMVFFAGQTIAAAESSASQQIEQLTLELADKPNDALLWYRRGELFRAQREYTRALADYAQAELLEPWLEPIYLSRGRAFYESGRFPEAYRALTQFLQMAPGHAEALLFRARTRIQLGQPHAAELDFSEALSHEKTPAPELFMERASNLSQQGKVGPALAVLGEAITRFGPLDALQESALGMEVRAKRWEDALRRIEGIWTRSSHKELLLWRKAQVLEGMGDHAGAREARRAALLQIAGLPEPQRKLADTRKLARELENALSRYESAPRK